MLDAIDEGRCPSNSLGYLKQEDGIGALFSYRWNLPRKWHAQFLDTKA